MEDVKDCVPATMPVMSDQSVHIGELAKALAAAQGEIKPVIAGESAKVEGKDGKRGFEYSYATLIDHHEAARAPLAKHGLAVLQTTRIEKGLGTVLVTTLVHASGQWKKSEIVLPQSPTPQAFGSMMSYYRRYEWSAIVGTATREEDDDAQEAERQGKGEERNYAPPKPQMNIDQTPKEARRVTEKQLNRLYAIARGGRWTRDQVIAYMTDSFQKREPAELNWAEYDTLCTHILENPKGDEQSQVPPEERAAAAVDKQKALTPIQANNIRNLAKEHRWPAEDLKTYLNGLAGRELKSVNELPSTKFDEACKFIRENSYPAAPEQTGGA